MRIAFYLEEGSRSFIFSPPDLYGRGLGGAEQALICVTEELARRGHVVSVYNSTEEPGIYSGVIYFNSSDFDPSEELDVFVLFRNPYKNIQIVNAKQKIFWSCDQFTSGNYALDIFPYVDKTIAISEYHKSYLSERYMIEQDKIFAIDLGVRKQDYSGLRVQKKPYSLLYCSVPDRGLFHLSKIFPLIQYLVPEANLTITSSYALWGKGIPDGVEYFKSLFDGMENVEYLSAVPRSELVKIQARSEILAYPNQPVNGLTELFGISVAECQYVGCLPVCTPLGGLATTLLRGSVEIEGLPQDEGYYDMFISRVIDLLTNIRELRALQKIVSEGASEIFDYGIIASEWERVICL